VEKKRLGFLYVWEDGKWVGIGRINVDPQLLDQIQQYNKARDEMLTLVAKKENDDPSH